MDKKFSPLYYLLFQSRRPMRVVNFISFFRIIAFPIFMVLLVINRIDIFKWLLLVSFLTDAMDGYLARKFRVTSILGARLDSISDDLTVLAAFLGLIVVHPQFLLEQWLVIVILLILFLVQAAYAFIRYQKMTSFHTYIAKAAAVLQGIFMCAMFFLDEPLPWLFYLAAGTTALGLLEETLMIGVLPTWKADVRGLYWAMRERQKE
jgi:phosphatidylglycerophosphate synthase